MTAVPKLQDILLHVVPTYDLIEANLTHLFHRDNRFIRDLETAPIQPIPHWFLSLLFDTGNTSYFWFYRFIHKHVRRLPIGEVMFVGSQEQYKRLFSMEIFAARVASDAAVVLVYANPKNQKHGMRYPNRLPPLVTDQAWCSKWSSEEWAALTCLELECAFAVSL